MTAPTPSPRRHTARVAAWSAAALVLLVPLVAGLFTDEVAWSPGDFVFAGALLAVVGGLFELAVRASRDRAYRWGAGVALGTAFVLVWVTGAVGIIDSEDNAANLLYAGVLAVGLVGALVARARPAGMARALVATALAQAAVAVGALVADWGAPGTGPEIVLLNAVFVALWGASAALFHRAASPEGAPVEAAAP